MTRSTQNPSEKICRERDSAAHGEEVITDSVDRYSRHREARTSSDILATMCDEGSMVTYDKPSSLSARHRLVLHFLNVRGGEATLVKLADDIASWMDKGESVSGTKENVRKAYLDLHSTVVNELGPRGVVEYCESEGHVTLSR